jgi:glycosyltransferase involved in cell wall biosynthesis
MSELIKTSLSRLVTVHRTKINTDAADPLVSFAMPAWNEEENIERAVNECRDTFISMGLSNNPSDKQGGGHWGEIVVTNDCSKDRTPDILSSLQEKMPNLVIVTHLEKNQGYGRALSDAITASRGTWIATIDSDGQFDPGDLLRMFSLTGGKDAIDIDCVAGYRMKKKDSITRIIADRSLNLIVRIMFGIKHRDTNCAFKLIRGDILRNLQIETNGFQTPTEIILKLNALKYRMVECGVSHRSRGEGKSKLKVLRTSIDFLRFLFYLKNKITLYRKRILARL